MIGMSDPTNEPKGGAAPLTTLELDRARHPIPAWLPHLVAYLFLRILRSLRRPGSLPGWIRVKSRVSGLQMYA